MYGKWKERKKAKALKYKIVFIYLFIYFTPYSDISYADDYENDQYEGIWEQFMTNMDEIYARKPYMVCPG